MSGGCDVPDARQGGGRKGKKATFKSSGNSGTQNSARRSGGGRSFYQGKAGEGVGHSGRSLTRISGETKQTEADLRNDGGKWGEGLVSFHFRETLGEQVAIKQHRKEKGILGDYA